MDIVWSYTAASADPPAAPPARSRSGYKHRCTHFLVPAQHHKTRSKLRSTAFPHWYHHPPHRPPPAPPARCAGVAVPSQIQSRRPSSSRRRSTGRSRWSQRQRQPGRNRRGLRALRPGFHAGFRRNTGHQLRRWLWAVRLVRIHDLSGRPIGSGDRIRHGRDRFLSSDELPRRTRWGVP